MLLIAGPDVVRLAPALIVSDAQLIEADRIMRDAAEANSRGLSTPPDDAAAGRPILSDSIGEFPCMLSVR
jgi:hypothetical protein